MPLTAEQVLSLITDHLLGSRYILGEKHPGMIQKLLYDVLSLKHFFIWLYIAPILRPLCPALIPPLNASFHDKMSSIINTYFYIVPGVLILHKVATTIILSLAESEELKIFLNDELRKDEVYRNQQSKCLQNSPRSLINPNN